MAEAARITQIGASEALMQPNKPQENGKSQLQGESALWFRRYCLYRDLGHKRSLRAAVAKERKALCVVASPEPATKSTTKKAVTPPAAPLAPVIHVPGSWKNASKVYRWQERARAFDLHLLDLMTRSTHARLGDTYANKYKRVQLLELLINSSVDQLNTATSNGTKHATYLAYIKQIAALTTQMEREMSRLTDEEMKAAITAYGFCNLDEIEKARQIGQR